MINWLFLNGMNLLNTDFEQNESSPYFFCISLLTYELNKPWFHLSWYLIKGKISFANIPIWFIGFYLWTSQTSFCIDSLTRDLRRPLSKWYKNVSDTVI